MAKPPLSTRKDLKRQQVPLQRAARSGQGTGEKPETSPPSGDPALGTQVAHRGQLVTRACELNTPCPPPPQHNVLWPLPGAKSTQHPSGPKPKENCLPGHAGCCGVFSLLLQNQDMEEKKRNPPNIPVSWRAWCDVTLERGAHNHSGKRPWGAQEMNLPKPGGLCLC